MHILFFMFSAMHSAWAHCKRLIKKFSWYKSNEIWTGKRGSITLAKSYIRCIPGLQIWVRLQGREKGSQWEWDQRPLLASVSIGSSKKSITLHLCNLLLFIKHFHIPYLPPKMFLNVKACPYSQRQANTPEFQIYGRVEGVRRPATFPNKTKFCPLEWREGHPRGPFKTLPPPKFLLMLRISPSSIPSG